MCFLSKIKYKYFNNWSNFRWFFTSFFTYNVVWNGCFQTSFSKPYWKSIWLSGYRFCYKKKSESNGIRGWILEWLFSFLESRNVVVTTGGITSGVRETDMEVPQGSVLGALMFLLFISDLPQHMTLGFICQQHVCRC